MKSPVASGHLSVLLRYKCRLHILARGNGCLVPYIRSLLRAFHVIIQLTCIFNETVALLCDLLKAHYPRLLLMKFSKD